MDTAPTHWQHFTGPPTAPASPTSSDPHQFTYGFNGVMGGGDTPHRLSPGASLGERLTSPSLLRVPHQRVSAAKRNTGRLLGSPIRLLEQGGRLSESSSPSRAVRRVSRPLVRAAQAPIPLCNYPSPPSRSQQVLTSPTEVEDLLLDPLSSPADVGPALVNPMGAIMVNPNGGVDLDAASLPGDNFSTAVALVVLASINAALDGKHPQPALPSQLNFNPRVGYHP